nr:glycosyltransferase family 4 protein [Desulfobacula sp.]
MHSKGPGHTALCGTAGPCKNHAAIIRAVEKIRMIRPDVLLVIFGSGPLKEELDACIKAADLENHVKIIDKKTKQADMHLVYSSTRLFLSPSRYEIFGMTVLEAMACGLPVIGSSVGGMKDIISHGKNGLLIDPESEDEISEAVLLLLNTPSLYHSISGNGIQTSRGFSWDRVAEKMELAYKAAMKCTETN